jgi:hypothetical protein
MAGKVQTEGATPFLERLDAKEALVEPAEGTFDREFDSNPGRPAHTRPESLEQHQRIVVNPFLTVLAWVAGFALIRESLQARSLPRFDLGVLLLFVAFFLLQFHCLDCGATGWLFRYRSHACPAVVMRCENQDVRRFSRPRVKTQLIAWFLLMVSAFVLGMVVLSG